MESNPLSCRFSAVPACLLLAQPRLHLLGVELVVPGVEHGFPRGVQHPLAVPAPGGEQDLPALFVGEPAVPSGDLEARDEALDIPLEGPGEGLVEVVDVEHEAALGGAEETEVRQVRVAAELHREPGAGGGGQVRGHQQGRTAVERERRDHHAPVAHRDELRDATWSPAPRAATPGRCGPSPGDHARVARPGAPHPGRPAVRPPPLEVRRMRRRQIRRGRLLGHGISSHRRDRPSRRRDEPQSVTRRLGRILSVPRRLARHREGMIPCRIPPPPSGDP